ncbi:MAG: DegT/DnrJ/EryC1/StrS family aminotransferase [Proteobacteria bacterium]|nr:DegT/DnrJ/EryC1/StrS family aminotransferase [Pseudomonadota bacterium]
MLDLVAELDQIGDEIFEALGSALRSGRYILGPNVEAFEREAAEFLGARFAVGLNSGTDALVIGLRALGIRPGDEVVTTGFSFFATAEAIANVGAVPAFADIEPDTFNLDPEAVEARIGPRTRAILPVHLFGHPAAMDEIGAIAERNGLPLLEDAAQAFGARLGGRPVGSLGRAAAFSFFPSKNLGAFGDGGLLVTSDEDLARQARRLRDHGAGRDRYRSESLGYNSRLDELQAAILRVKLRRLEAFNRSRRRVADAYAERLRRNAEIATPIERPGAWHAFHQYTLRLPDRRRDPVRRRLAEAGIASAVYYPGTLAQQAPFAHLEAELPRAEQATREVLSLPIGPTLSESQISRVCDELVAALS